jgi:hypothetical protein
MRSGTAINFSRVLFTRLSRGKETYKPRYSILADIDLADRLGLPLSQIECAICGLFWLTVWRSAGTTELLKRYLLIRSAKETGHAYPAVDRVLV